MVQGIAVFVRERFPLRVSVPLAVVLSLGSLDAPMPGPWLELALCVWLLLFCARASDDLIDRHLDAVHKPERALPSGRVTARALASAAGLAFATALLLLASRSPTAVGAVTACALVLLSFYYARPRIPVVLGPLLVNATFFVVMMLGPLENGLSSRGWLLAAFVWLSTVGHDFAHSIEGNPSRGPGLDMAPLQRARWGATFFAAASLAGGLFSALAHDAVFAGLLFATSVWLAVLLWSLMRAPSERIARRIYVPGFLYFLLPMLGRIACNLLA